MALAKKIYFAFEALIDDAERMRPEAMHHLKTMTECFIYFSYVGKNGDVEARRVLCEMAKKKKKYADKNPDFATTKEQSAYWGDLVGSLGRQGISVEQAATDGGSTSIYNRIYRQACEPAHLADLYEYLPDQQDSFTLGRSAVSPIWASAALSQAIDLAITLLTDVSSFFKLNINDRLTKISANANAITLSLDG